MPSKSISKRFQKQLKCINLPFPLLIGYEPVIVTIAPMIRLDSFSEQWDTIPRVFPVDINSICSCDVHHMLHGFGPTSAACTIACSLFKPH